jgi:serine/threonine protein kinase
MELTSGLDSQLLLGRYRVVARLAEGGMGKVYLARVEGAEGFTKPVVVKVMRPDMRAMEDGNRLFSREALILSKMQHPAVPGILDFGTQDGARVMVLDYVHGYSLANWLDFRFGRGEMIPVDLCLFVVRRVLDALHYAHTFESAEGERVEIVHRDVAADNVLLDRKGYAYLLDFGIASITGKDRRVTAEAGTFRGKLGYAAPETVEGSRATPLSDQYSAGILLLELLTLEAPFQSDTVAETVLRMVQEDAPLPSTVRSDIPPDLDRVLQRVLRKDPSERFPSVFELSRELRRLQAQGDEEALEELRRTLEKDFEELPNALGVESLKVREAALSRIFEAGARELVTPSFGQSDVPAKSSRHLLAIVAASGVAIAIALGMLIALLTGGEGEQVVVVSGEREGAKLGSAPSAPTVDSALPGAAPAPEAEDSKTRELNQALQTQAAAFERCFVDHLDLDQTDQAPEVLLHFTIPAGGADASVSVEPKDLAKTPLGTCLARASDRVPFPALDHRVSFRVPVRARFAQTK